MQPIACKYYEHPKAQAFVATLIMGNFVCNIIEKQIDPASVQYTPQFTVLETVFNISFLIELIVRARRAHSHTRRRTRSELATPTRAPPPANAGRSTSTPGGFGSSSCRAGTGSTCSW